MAIDRPWATTLPPKRTLPREEAELESELAELQEIEVKQERNRQRHADPIGELISAKLCKRNQRFWFIQYQGSSVSVTHYYPEKNVAIDVFEFIGPVEAREVAFKRAAFKAEGIRYAAIDWAVSDVAEILPQITKMKLWPFGKR